ncbi:MAG: hypothetical protein HY053_06695 [Proteobacteria bacterium]|nr:hypothetical protein [Pseudomonadota bacterium]
MIRSWLLMIAMLFLCSPAWAAPEPDTSCKTDADCMVKNVGNCCGYYPRCVNKEARVDPEAVARECAKKKMAGICGFLEIKSCICVEGQCQAHGIDSGIKPIKLK